MESDEAETLSTDSTIIMVLNKPIADPIPQQKRVINVERFMKEENLEVVNVSI